MRERNAYPVKLSPEAFKYWDDQAEDLCDRNLLERGHNKAHIKVFHNINVFKQLIISTS